MYVFLSVCRYVRTSSQYFNFNFFLSFFALQACYRYSKPIINIIIRALALFHFHISLSFKTIIIFFSFCFNSYNLMVCSIVIFLPLTHSLFSSDYTSARLTLIFIILLFCILFKFFLFYFCNNIDVKIFL
jgi:hypothetical protein